MSADYDDRVRGFAAFASGTRIQRRSLSWWGNAWIAAVEASSLDPEPLTKGRADAYAGLVGDVTVSAGRIAATVAAADGSAYRTEVQLEQWSPEQWVRFLDEVAAASGHIAALLDGDLPPDLVDAAHDADIPLLPGPGDLDPVCSCDEFDSPCRHAAALCYQVARLLDEDPFVLLLLRGRARSEVLELLEQRAPRRAESEQAPQPVTLARDAYAATPSALPEDPPVPLERPHPVDVPSALGVDRDGVAWLVADAALRAREWLATAVPPEEFDSWRDAVRLAATLGDRRAFARLRDATRRPDEFPRATRAWGYGAAAGLDVLENPRQLTKSELVAANVSIDGAWDEVDAPAFAVAGNRWTLVGRGLQVRYGIDGRWYPYRDESGEWWPAGPPQSDPAVALADLL